MSGFFRVIAWAQFVLGLVAGAIGESSLAAACTASGCWWYLVANREEADK